MLVARRGRGGVEEVRTYGGHEETEETSHAEAHHAGQGGLAEA